MTTSAFEGLDLEFRQLPYASNWPSDWPLSTSAVVARPEIVCLCGSTRFQDEFREVNGKLTMEGKIVLSVGVFVNATPVTPSEKASLDALHKQKILLADSIYVINPGGYIGESTSGEIGFAIDHGKPVAYMTALIVPRRESNRGRATDPEQYVE